MKWRIIPVLACCAFVVACSKPGPGVPETAPAGTAPAPAVPLAAPGTQPPGPSPLERPPIDLGDVDSGVFIRGVLAPQSQSPSVTAESIETLRGTVSLTTITVREPFPERLMVRFEVTANRIFEERPVVVRARAYRNENEVIGDGAAWVLGREATILPRDEAGNPVQRAYTVDVLEGLDAIPDTMLVHGRADAWLMPVGTVETLLDPRVADSSERVPLMGNPVRINFVRTDAAQ